MVYMPEREQDNLQRVESSEHQIVQEGFVVGFLQDDFLYDAFHGRPDWWIHAPEVVEHILVPLLEKSHISAELFGSVPKCIAGGVPGHFWDYSRYLAEVARKLRESGQPDEVVQIPLELSTGGAVDMDISLDTDPAMFLDMFHAIRQSHGVEPFDFSTIPVHTPDGQVVDGHAFECISASDDRFAIHVYTGPVPTNVKIPIFVLTLLDRETKERIFHVDFVVPPQDATSAYGEKRQGATSAKQDECIAQLTVQDGRLHYAMTRHAVDVMNGPDALLTESNDTASNMEIGFRAVRMNTLHEVEALNSLRAFMPLFRSDSLFDFRHRMLRFAQEQNELSPSVLPLIMRELALCLTIDPYVTVQFLRDSGIALLIPGLRNLTREDWDAILRSKQFVLEVIDGKRAATKSDRNWVFMEWQREYYRLGEPEKKIEKQYDGVERFMMALAELYPELFLSRKEDAWAMYRSLWVDPKQRVEIATKDHAIDVPSQAVAVIRIDNFIIFNSAPNSKQVNLNTLAKKLRDAARGESDLEEQLKRIRSILRQRAKGSYYMEIINKYYAISEEIARLREEKREVPSAMVAEFNRLSDRFRSVALVYHILEQYPFGLTPRELERLYDTQETGFMKGVFQTVFLDLKLLGVVVREKTTRHGKSGGMKDVELYSLTRSGPTNISEVVKHRRFVDIYWRLLEDRTNRRRPYEDGKAKGEVTSRENMLYRNGLKTMESLAALTDVDFSLLRSVTNFDARGYGLIPQIAKLFVETWRIIQDDQV